MTGRVIKLYKNKGETPLNCIEKLKKDNEGLKSLPMTYAGRLDPLAEGVLLLLIGDECLKKEEYLNLDKEYEVDILFGFATDTYDLMGKIISSPEILFERSRGLGGGSRCQTISNSISGFDLFIKKFIGKIKQNYPQYSSKTVNGKPLWLWAREGKVSEIEIPKHEVLIKNIEVLGESKITGKDLLEKIEKDIALVSGDFRQEEILEDWGKTLQNFLRENFGVLSLRVSSSSGAYMRSLTNDIGQELGVPALALNIKRTKIGEYKI